jgi:hypothetical protein
VEYGHWVGLMRMNVVQSAVVWLLVLSRVCDVCPCVCVFVCVNVYWGTCSPFSSA